jgi:hypothetical protein
MSAKRLPNGRFASTQTTAKKTTKSDEFEQTRQALLATGTRAPVIERIVSEPAPVTPDTFGSNYDSVADWGWLRLIARLIIVLVLLVAVLAVGFLAGRLTA